MALIIDSDILCEPDRVREAVQRTAEHGKITLPFDVRYNLTAFGTKRILNGYKGNWKPYIGRVYHDQHSSVFAIRRDLWDAVGGFDEGFSGWGLEDTAFAIACEMFVGRADHMKGEVWHLYHAAAPEQKHGTPSHTANMARAERYREAWQHFDKEAVRLMVVEGRTMEHSRTSLTTIPTILHRVVPEHSPDVAEQWWQQFTDLHPGWRMLTHRDPLDPKEWPITSPHWNKVANGAQLADLVRLEALLTIGGIYVDQDVQPFRSLSPLTRLEAFAAWEDERVIPNAILGARPDHPAIRRCLDLAIKRMTRGTWDAGPGVTTEVLQGREDVLVLPPHLFYAVHYRDPDRDSKMFAKPSPWEYARHHYWGSWLPEERRRVPA